MNQILIIEDEVHLLNHHHKLLKKHLPKAKFYLATNGLEALNILAEQKIDLVFSDIKMPQSPA